MGTFGLLEQVRRAQAPEERRAAGAGVPSAAELCFLSAPADFTAQRARRAQLERLVALLPLVGLLAVIHSALLAASLHGRVAAVALACWLGAVALVGAGLALFARRTRGRHSNPTRPLLAGVALAAALWTVPALFWLGEAGPEQRLPAALVIAAMMIAGGATMAVVPPAAIIHVLVLGATLAALGAGLGMPVLAATALLCGLVLGGSSLWTARQFVAHFRARAELGEKGEMIALLREFDASGSDWLWELDGDLRLTFLSSEMVRHIGIRGTDFLGMPMARLVDPSGRVRSVSTAMRSLFEHLEGGLAFRELIVPIADGQRWWSLSGKPKMDAGGRCIGWRGVGSDVTEARASGSHGLAAARHDPMTGLGNRLLVREQLEQALLRDGDGEGACALLLVDLDRFKLVNDTLGHSVGDQLLCEVARRLRECVGEPACIGRVAGDEFAVLCPGGRSDSELAGLAELLIASLSQPFLLNGSELTIGATAGIARGPRDGRSQDELARSAGLALCRAKEAGRGSFRFFDPRMGEEARSRRQLENDLRGALRSGGLTLAFQPIVAAAGGAVVGHEALLRWNHPERGDIPPDLFVPVIEDVGLISQVGNWVIQEACAEAAAWPEPLTIAVNVSAAQLAGPELAATVVRALGTSGLAPERLELEITESLFLGDDAETLDSLERLRMLGVRLVLDDFGTGYCSFGYLARARFNKIKIDKSFVHAVAEGSRQARAIVEAIIALAHGLSLTITAEGVESADQARLMQRMGCDLLQGFHFGRPELVRPLLALEPGADDRKRA